MDAETIERPAETGSALAIIPRFQVATILAADPDDILGKLKAEIDAFEPDISTKEGQDAIRALAARVASAKVRLVKIGKGLTEGWREKTALVNAECRIIEDRMDELKEKVRAPLTSFENAEKARKALCEQTIADMHGLTDFHGEQPTVEQIADRLDTLPGLTERDWREFSDRASKTYAAVKDRLGDMLIGARRRDEEAAELARLRAEAAERARVEGHKAALAAISEPGSYPEMDVSANLRIRLRQLENYPARDWEEFADRAAEALRAEIDRTRTLLAAAQEREAEAQRIREAQIAEDAARLATEQAEAAAKAEAERVAQAQREADERAAEAARKAAELVAKAEADRTARNQRGLAALDRISQFAGTPTLAEVTHRMWRLKDAAALDWEEFAGEAKVAIDSARAILTAMHAQLTADADAARAAAAQAEADRIRAAEQKRLADEAEARRLEDEKRAKNKAHREAIRAAAIAALQTEGLSASAAKLAMEAISRGAIPRVRVEY